jgi:hypothetical protein
VIFSLASSVPHFHPRWHPSRGDLHRSRPNSRSSFVLAASLHLSSKQDWTRVSSPGRVESGGGRQGVGARFNASDQFPPSLNVHHGKRQKSNQFLWSFQVFGRVKTDAEPPSLSQISDSTLKDNEDDDRPTKKTKNGHTKTPSSRFHVRELRCYRPSPILHSIFSGSAGS